MKGYNARIIDNKKVLMTEDQYNFYKNICRGYDRPAFKGELLFQDHFEVDDHGVLLFIKPPQNKYSSMEVYTFLLSLMTTQHISIMREQVETFIEEGKDKLKELLSRVNEEVDDDGAEKE